MGSTSSEDLLNEPWEQALFQFYRDNQKNYHCVADVGANIGIHCIQMAELGWSVIAYEPDPVHVVELRRNVKSNGVLVDIVEAAVSTQDGFASFVQVPRNTTENHLGPSELMVRTVDCRKVFAWADFVKLDVEGHEAAILCCLPAVTWEKVDTMVEIGGEENARQIFQHFRALHVPMIIKGQPVTDFDQMPQCCKDGMLFIGWN